MPLAVRSTPPLLLAALALAATAVAGTAAAAERPLKDYNWGKRVAKAERYAKQRAGKVSFSVRARGVRRSFGGRRTYASASVVKAMLIVVYLRQRRDQRLSSAEKRRLRRMIRRSDNQAATEIRDIVGNDSLEDLADRIGMRCFATATSWGSTRICSRDQALLMARLPKLLPKRHRGFAMAQLRRIVPDQRWGIPKATDWTPYFKGGWYPDPDGWRIHQIALLRGPRHRGGPRHRRLALAVLSSGQRTYGYGQVTIRGVAQRLIGPITKR